MISVAATTTNSVTLAWKDSSNVATYSFFHGTNGNNPFQLEDDYTTDVPVTNFTYAGLMPGQTYSFVIAVSDGFGLNAYSGVIVTNTLSASGVNVVTGPDAPVTLNLQTAISPSGLPDPNNPFWIHITTTSPVVNKWIIQDSLDLVNWSTFQYLSNSAVNVWVTPQGYFSSRYFRLIETNW